MSEREKFQWGIYKQENNSSDSVSIYFARRAMKKDKRPEMDRKSIEKFMLEQMPAKYQQQRFWK
jgi:hypothetical protein